MEADSNESDPRWGESDPRWGESEARLVARIRDEILAAPERRITFARFMEAALAEPGLGYYATSELRPTRSGDFLTAPELHPFFGRCLGRFLSAAWQRSGSPRRYVVREYGAGRGTLRDAVLAGASADGSGLEAILEWQGLDLADRSSTPSASSSVDVALANEYLDALPVHRVVREGELREIFVGWDGWFHELVAAPSTPELAGYLADEGVELPEGQEAEIRLAAPAWLADVARDARLVLVIDYGHPAGELYGPRRPAGSLLTYRRHEVGDDPYAAVGRADITAHVDTTALERAAAGAGLQRLGATSQAEFLEALGLGELLDALGRNRATDMPTYLAARSAVARLLDPRHLGGFRVLAWARPEQAAELRGLPGLPTDA